MTISEVDITKFGSENSHQLGDKIIERDVKKKREKSVRQVFPVFVIVFPGVTHALLPTEEMTSSRLSEAQREERLSADILIGSCLSAHRGRCLHSLLDNSCSYSKHLRSSEVEIVQAKQTGLLASD